MRILMQTVSTVFHPLTMPVNALIAMYFCRIYPVSSYVALLIIWNYVLTPGVLLWALRKCGVVSSLSMQQPRDRIIGLAVAGTWCGVATGLPGSWLPIGLLGLWWSFTLSLGILAVGNLKMKISLHAAAAGNVVGYLLAAHSTNPTPLLFWGVIIGVLITGLVMSARLYLKAHRAIETYVGATIGILTAYGVGLWFTR